MIGLRYKLLKMLEMLEMLDLGVFYSNDLKIINEGAGNRFNGIKFPLTVYSIVTLNTFKKINVLLNRVSDERVFESRNEQIRGSTLNWKPLDDISQIKQAAIDFKVRVSNFKFNSKEN